MAQILRGLTVGGVDPHPGVAGEATGAGQPEIAEHFDDQLLDAVDVARGGVGTHGDRHDRIAHQLAGTVVGDVTTPVGADQLGPDGGRVDEHVLVLGPHPEGVDVAVLLKEEPVVTP